MSTQATDTSLRMSRTINASPERVFQAWTDPAQMKQWAAPEGVTVEIAEVDLSVGGKYHIRMRNDDGQQFNAVGSYREVTPNEKLVYTWQWLEKEHDAGETLVTVEFNNIGDKTEIVLMHELFPNAEARDAHDQGWTSCLNRFVALF